MWVWILNKYFAKKGFCAVGIDISETAIIKARDFNPGSCFMKCELRDIDKIKLFDSDIYIMSEITWYILDELDEFLKNLRSLKPERSAPIFLIHILSTYAPGVQKYGTNKFTNLEEILNYFNLDYLEYGFIETSKLDDSNSQGTYFIAKI